MKRLRNHWIGIDQGDTVMFSDFEDGGEMWTGHGPREKRRRIKFRESFRTPPVIQCALSMWDTDNTTFQRGDISAERIEADGFELVFKTWADSRIARARIRWTAIGELRHADEWDIY
ncbi:ATP synthase [Oceanicola sp. 22II-s10i]|uniref:H-type lectin domain-containing protein n=1 Tax=Oceanicola sp. 22II-s10i TaxID=1317116 RepID=UPI000B526D3B|nr:H-type lectin domain-containing protein [Oceanicola sp. 22II-s10i]OWU84143.1 ATP synthase [Oceanicola sp. 22II-s10i]